MLLQKSILKLIYSNQNSYDQLDHIFKKYNINPDQKISNC